MRPPICQDVGGRLREDAALIERLGRAVVRAPDVDKVHDFRVLVRRTLAAVWVARRLAPRGAFRGVRRRLHRLLPLLGRVRLLDVAIRDAKRFRLPTQDLVRRRTLALERLVDRLDPRCRAKLTDRLTGRAGGLRDAGLFDLALSLAGRAGRLRSAVARAERGKAEMHRLRIEAKRARYLLEILGRPHERLDELQRRLGRTHDMEVLRRLLGRHEVVARAERKERRDAVAIMYDAVQQGSRELMRAAREIWSATEDEA